MKRLLILVAIAVLGKVGYDHMVRDQRGKVAAQSTDKAIERMVQDLNAQLPMKGPHAQLDKVAYVDRVLRISGAWVSASELSDGVKNEFRKSMTQKYCGSGGFVQHKVDVEYLIAIPSRDFNNVIPQEWSLKLTPAVCA